MLSVVQVRRFLTVRRHDHSMAGSLERLGQDIPDVLLVVDYKDSRHLQITPRWGRARQRRQPVPPSPCLTLTDCHDYVRSDDVPRAAGAAKVGHYVAHAWPSVRRREPLC